MHATEIPLPWYRVQALASVAKAAPDDRVDAILDMATDEARREMDAYRRVAVVAWVIDAALARGRTEFALHSLQCALDECAGVTPVKSRAEALHLLLEQATKIGEHDTRRVAEALLDAAAALSADPVRKWRKWGKSYIHRATWTLSRAHMSLADNLLSARFGPERAAAILARHATHPRNEDR